MDYAERIFGGNKVKIEAGKKYVTRDGQVFGPMFSMTQTLWIERDAPQNKAWWSDGSPSNTFTPLLIREHIEPTEWPQVGDEVVHNGMTKAGVIAVGQPKSGGDKLFMLETPSGFFNSTATFLSRPIPETEWIEHTPGEWPKCKPGDELELKLDGQQRCQGLAETWSWDIGTSVTHYRIIATSDTQP
jgi:hypothetical protein